MFLILISVLFGLTNYYVWRRLIKGTTRPGLVRRMLTSALIVLTVLVAATLILPRLAGVSDSSWFAWPGFIGLALFFYLFMITVVLELPRLALRGWVKGKPLEATATADTVTEPVEEEPAPVKPAMSRRLFLARATAVTAVTASASVVGVGMASALGPPDLLRVPVRLPRLDPAFNGFRIAVVSDIHLGPLSGLAHTERIVRMINETSPDLVAIVGDMVDGTVAELGPAAAPLRDLDSRDGTYFVTGNHEYYVEDPESWMRELERLDVRPLRNENTVIRRGGAAFDLAGVNDIIGEPFDGGPDFDRALSGRDSSRPTILLAHQPVQVEEAAAHGVDLQLSGHTHGGQLWPFHYLVQLAQPSLAGLSTVDGTQLYVSRGAGYWGPPVRIGARPDITVISLQSED
jgi:uncharacterized protein